ncbi:methyltransferase domain-containing protein [Lysobacter sp. TY2-98]|uniref:class I SAM-dependent methyltransferase n=1 Tax=Lysobacter sp. TY2-98 TaxID=2290922 RepID=UPI000E1FF48B|nr:class I SAM-dependent methyltransferase [Lysobacter sp. TY2-98]AXK72105.1 methyltransferase domain-containing protein [Lysobacter sp. TY2-98]
MRGQDANFATGIADVYARLLVPMLFEPYAADLATRIAAFKPHDVLETAAGTGALTREIASHLPDAHLVATDLNAPMLEMARAYLPPSVKRRVADAQSLPFDDASFDVVACQFGAMFFPDHVLAYSEARRVLRPSGRFVFNVWDSLAANPVTAAISDVLMQRFPDDPPDFMARVPHGYHDADRVRHDLADAGFHDVRIMHVDAIAPMASAHDAAIAFCSGTPMRHEIDERDPGGIDDAIVAVTSALEARFGQGRIDAPMRALVIEARV